MPIERNSKGFENVWTKRKIFQFLSRMANATNMHVFCSRVDPDLSNIDFLGLGLGLSGTPYWFANLHQPGKWAQSTTVKMHNSFSGLVNREQRVAVCLWQCGWNIVAKLLVEICDYCVVWGMGLAIRNGWALPGTEIQRKFIEFIKFLTLAMKFQLLTKMVPPLLRRFPLIPS